MQACRIAANDLACRRGDRLLFAGVNFSLAAGEALHLAGPNGIGKSSLIRLLAGLLTPFAGTVERDGAVGLLDEYPALDPFLPLGKALQFWTRLDGSDAGDNESVAQRLGLSALFEVPVRFLSTGQRKRAALARLLGQQAPLWMLDEPLNGLDSRAAGIVQDLVAEHCARGGIAVIASHQPFVLAEMTRFALQDHAA